MHADQVLCFPATPPNGTVRLACPFRDQIQVTDPHRE